MKRWHVLCLSFPRRTSRKKWRRMGKSSDASICCWTVVGTCLVLRNKLCSNLLVATRQCLPPRLCRSRKRTALVVAWGGHLGLGGCALSFVSWPLGSMKCGKLASPTWCFCREFIIYIYLYIYISLSLSFSFLLALSMNLAELRRRLLTGQTRLPCEADLFFDHQKRKLPVWERFLGSDRYVPGL